MDESQRQNRNRQWFVQGKSFDDRSYLGLDLRRRDPFRFELPAQDGRIVARRQLNHDEADD